LTGRKALDSSPLTTANQEATYDDKASSSTYEIGSAPPLSQTSKRNFHSRCASIGSHQIGRKGADGGLCRSPDSEEQKLICYMVRLRKRWHAGHGGDSVEQRKMEHRSSSQQRRDRRRCPRSRDRALSRSLSRSLALAISLFCSLSLSIALALSCYLLLFSLALFLSRSLSLYLALALFLSRQLSLSLAISCSILSSCFSLACSLCPLPLARTCALRPSCYVSVPATAVDRNSDSSSGPQP
jgi:hypothetical protein